MIKHSLSLNYICVISYSSASLNRMKNVFIMKLHSAEVTQTSIALSVDYRTLGDYYCCEHHCVD